MLKSIYIDNYALIDSLEIDLLQGLTIMTGETGAGKSILLGALGLLLGKRADTAVLKDGERKCIVEGVFLLDKYEMEPFFNDNELDYQDETIIRREINSNGKSRAFVNDIPVTLDTLQSLTVPLIDIHSQYQNLSLNSEGYVRWIIDCFAGLTADVENFRRSWLKFSDLRKTYYSAREVYQTDKENFDLLNHQFAELHAAKLISGELIALDEEFAVLNHAEEIKSALSGCMEQLTSEEHGIIRKLKMVSDLLSRIKKHYPKLSELDQRVESTFIELKDVADTIADRFDKVEFDPDRYEQIRARLDIIHSLLHKYRVPEINDLIDIREQLDKKLAQFSSGDIELENLARELKVSEKQVIEAANQISLKRKSVFNLFEGKVQDLIRNLGMKNARFTIQHEDAELSATGIDKVQFLFSANNNVPVQPIAKVASGGELSRLMLSIKYLISTASRLPTIVFDEVDTGVSGEIADKVGRLIKEMSEHMQVINITHLPQVASKGDHHYLVFKEVADRTTITRIKKLNNTERLNEIARMLSGDSITEAAIENAKVLLRS